jgi:hypothetical protein
MLEFFAPNLKKVRTAQIVLGLPIEWMENEKGSLLGLTICILRFRLLII